MSNENPMDENEMDNAEKIAISREQLLDMQKKLEDAGSHHLRYYMPYDPNEPGRSGWTKGLLISVEGIIVINEESKSRFCDLDEMIQHGKLSGSVDAEDIQVVVRVNRIEPSCRSPYGWEYQSGQGWDEVISMPDVYDSMFSAAATKHPKLKKRPFRELLSDVREWVMEYDADGVDHVRWIDSTSGEEKVRTLDLTPADQT